MKSNKHKFIIFFLICALESSSANLVHPVTPAFVVNLGLPSSVFGFAFSAMSLTNFLFSSFWGKLVDKIGHKSIIAICCFGYALGQYFFLISTTSLHIILARLFSGMFVGGIVVSQLTYIVKQSDSHQKGKNLTILSTVLAVFAAIGFLIGGKIGSHNIKLSFLLQIALLSLSGILYYITADKPISEKLSFNYIGKTFFESSPVHFFIDIKKYITPSLLLLSLVVFLSTSATIDHDQTFNFYIKDVFNLNPSYNGMIKALVAIIALIFNTTICTFIIKKLNISKSLIGLFIIMTLNATLIVLTNNMYLFIAVNIFYYGFNIVYVPLLQYTFSNSNKEISAGLIMGQYNSLKSLGMIVGALIEATFYKIAPKVPIVISGALFLVCALILLYGIVSKKLSKNKSIK